MRFKDEIPLKDLIHQVVDQQHLRPGLLEARIIAEWTQMVGEHIAKYTSKIQVRKGVLMLEITSPALRNELMYQRKLIAERVNKELNCDFISDVEIR